MSDFLIVLGNFSFARDPQHDPSWGYALTMDLRRLRWFSIPWCPEKLNTFSWVFFVCNSENRRPLQWLLVTSLGVAVGVPNWQQNSQLENFNQCAPFQQISGSPLWNECSVWENFDEENTVKGIGLWTNFDFLSSTSLVGIWSTWPLLNSWALLYWNGSICRMRKLGLSNGNRCG